MLSTAGSLAALAGALLCWPPRPARDRVASLAGFAARPRRRQLRLHRPGTAVIAMGVVALGLLFAGIGGAVAAGLVGLTAMARWQARRADAQRAGAAADLVVALGLLVAELRAGAHPAAGAERVAGDASPTTAAVLGTVAMAARLSGDVAGALRRVSHQTPALAQPVARLAAAWTLADRHGIGLADVLEAVRSDLEHRVRAARRLTAALAGPRATATVLALLPLAGLALGQAVGVAPWLVLTESAAGQVLLVAGSALACTGVAWSARLVAKAAAP